MQQAKPWWLSKTIHGLLVLLLVQLAGLDEVFAQSFVADVLNVIGGGLVIVGLRTADKPLQWGASRELGPSQLD